LIDGQSLIGESRLEFGGEMVGKVADEGREQPVRIGGAGEDVRIGEQEALVGGDSVEKGKVKGIPRGGEKGFGSRVQPRGRERSGDLLHPPAREDDEGHVGGRGVLHGARHINDGEVRVEVILTRLQGGVEACEDEVIEKGFGIEDDARGFEAVRDGNGRFANFDGEELTRGIRRHGENAIMPEESQGVLIALTETELRRGMAVISLDLNRYVDEDEKDGAEEEEREEDEEATHCDLRFLIDDLRFSVCTCVLVYECTCLPVYFQVRLQNHHRRERILMACAFFARDAKGDAALAGILRAEGFVPHLDGDVGLEREGFGKTRSGSSCHVGVSFFVEGLADDDESRFVLGGERGHLRRVHGTGDVGDHFQRGGDGGGWVAEGKADALFTVVYCEDSHGWNP